MKSFPIMGACKSSRATNTATWTSRSSFGHDSGRGPDLHPYDEVFVVQDGELTFTVGDATIEATGGQIVIAPAGAPHKFVNSGTRRSRHIDIHTSRRMITDWLED
jgi:mannose-6-phosphate isomerase-like protein (cupin superfamily)